MYDYYLKNYFIKHKFIYLYIYIYIYIDKIIERYVKNDGGQLNKSIYKSYTR